ncbi:Aste57867_20950 [Aphanomyces stellatus]|uniref:Aste57867_20950 protein n=1 Tax=Aphanomyces stellatus TaxID=120398 RepID=A0A485LGZ9_9STRA|nr:hypothetical protein As57867_020882 [Aphanomyces stellatus]VFT97626.1 Aste57867_20950 [Aphanomyces stellatus]
MFAVATLFAAFAVVAQGSESQVCAQSYSQCDGQYWPNGVCCVDPNFDCVYQNEYLSLCLPHDDSTDDDSTDDSTDALVVGTDDAPTNTTNVTTVAPTPAPTDPLVVGSDVVTDTPTPAPTNATNATTAAPTNAPATTEASTGGR